MYHSILLFCKLSLVYDEIARSSAKSNELITMLLRADIHSQKVEFRYAGRFLKALCVEIC